MTKCERCDQWTVFPGGKMPPSTAGKDARRYIISVNADGYSPHCCWPVRWSKIVSHADKITQDRAPAHQCHGGHCKQDDTDSDVGRGLESRLDTRRQSELNHC